MANQAIVSKWTDAIIGLVQDRNLSLDSVFSQIQFLDQVFSSDANINWFLANNSVDKKLRYQIIRDYLSTHISSDLTNMLCLLIDYNLFLIVSDLLTQIEQRIDSLKNKVRGYVYSCIPLTKSQHQRIETKLSQRWKKKVILQHQLDLSLVGGIKVVTDFDIIDGSVQGTLRDMKNKILKLKFN